MLKCYLGVSFKLVNISCLPMTMLNNVLISFYILDNLFNILSTKFKAKLIKLSTQNNYKYVVKK